MKAIVFDMDGVLFDTERLIAKIWDEIAAEQTLEDMEKVLLSCIGRSRKDAATIFRDKYGAGFDYEGFRKRADLLFGERTQEAIPVKEGAYELLESLKEMGYKIGLASSTRKVSILSHLEKSKLGHYFEVILSGDMVEQSKPHPEIYLRACKALGVKPSETFAIEDSPNGVKSAYEAGLKTLMVPDLIQPTEEIKVLLHKEFRSLVEVKAYLEAMK